MHQNVAANPLMLYDDEGKARGYGQNNDCALHILIRIILNLIINAGK